MHEYDTVELTSDHLESSPSLVRGTQGIIVDLPANSAIAAVEFTLANDVEVLLLNLDELRLVESNQSHGHDSSRDSEGDGPR